MRLPKPLALRLQALDPHKALLDLSVFLCVYHCVIANEPATFCTPILLVGGPCSYFYTDVLDILEKSNTAWISIFLFPVVKWKLLTSTRGGGS